MPSSVGLQQPRFGNSLLLKKDSLVVSLFPHIYIATNKLSGLLLFILSICSLFSIQQLTVILLQLSEMSHLLPKFKVNSPKNKSFKEQFDQLRHQNTELIQLAQHISQSNFLQPNQYPPVIFKLEQELRSGFSAFVQSIREFFIDMDHRLRTLGQILAQQISIEQQQASRQIFNTVTSTETRQRYQAPKQNFFLKINQTNGDPFQMFSQRIATLEQNLKKTQENQHRLLNIVEKLNKRTSDQSTTQLYNPALNTSDLSSNCGIDNYTYQQQHPRMNNQRSFRVFALQPPQQQSRPWTQSKPEQRVMTKNQPLLQRPMMIFRQKPDQLHHLNPSESQHHQMRYMMHGLYNN